MPGHIEQLHRGLFTALDPAIMPPGALARAINARYRVGDPALWHAEGRAFLGTATHSSVALSRIGHLRWDPGTKFTGTDPQLSQLLYHNADGYFTTAISEVPEDNPPTPAAVISRAGVVQKAQKEGAIETLQIESEWVVTDGGQPRVLNRATDPVSGDTHQFMRELGLPQVGLVEYNVAQRPISDQEKFQRLVLVPTLSLLGGSFFPEGFLFFWYTFYNSTEKVEGACTGGAATVLRVDLPYRTGKVQILLPKDVLENVPTGTDSIRIYRTTALETLRSREGATTPITGGWPEGHRILEITIANLATNADVFIEAGDGKDALCREVHDVGFENSALDSYVIEQPYFESGSIDIGIGDDIPFNINGYPPPCNTATVFEGAMLCNDMTKRNRVRFSVDGKPDKFPDFNFLDFDTDDYDEVTKVRALGTSCGVYLKNSIWRVDWLPNIRDPLFARGRARDIVDSSRGAVWHSAVCDLTPPGGAPMHMFVHTSGIYVTNLDVVLPMTNHVDWDAMAPNKQGLAGACWLINNPDEQRVEFYHNNAVWYLHYDEAHMKNRVAAVTGPMERPGGLYASVPMRTPAGRTITVTTGNSGRLMYEGFGFIDEDAGTNSLNLDILSREMYLNRPLQEFRISDLLVHTKHGGGSGSWHASVLATDSAGDFAEEVATIKLSRAKAAIETHFLLADAISVRLHSTEADAAMAANFLAIGWEDYGDSETSDTGE